MQQEESLKKTEVLAEQLAYIVKSAKSKAKKEKVSLSHFLNIDRTTLWRWKNKINKDGPSPTTLLRLLQFDSGLLTIPEISNFYGGAISKYIKNSFHNFKESQTKISKNSILLNDKYIFYIYYICGTLKGSTEKDIIRTIGTIIARKAGISSDDLTIDIILSLGKIAATKIDYLKQEGILYEKNDGLLHITEKDFAMISDEKILYYSIDMIKDFLKPKMWAQLNTSHHVYQESLSLKSLKLLNIMKTKHYNEQKKFMIENRVNIDAIPCFISSTLETLSHNNSLEVLQ